MDLVKVVRTGENIRIEAVIYKTGKYLNFGNALFINEREELVAKGSAVGSCVYTKEEEEAIAKAPPELWLRDQYTEIIYKSVYSFISLAWSFLILAWVFLTAFFIHYLD